MITTLLVIAHWLSVLWVAEKVIFRRLPVGTSLAWIILAAVFPVFGFATYMLIGDHRLGRRRLKYGDIVRRYYQEALSIRQGAIRDSHKDIDDTFLRIADVAAKDTGFHIRSRNSVDILTEPEDMFTALERDIRQAETLCHLEFYIIHPEGRVLDILNAVADAASRGVECIILADHIGSKPFFKSDWPGRLEAAGVQVIDSLPTGIVKSLFLRSDLRNHRKLLILDRKIGYSGSFNLADPEYFKVDKGVGKWVDVLLRIEGDTAEAMSVVFNTDYVLETQEKSSLKKIPALTPLDHDKVPALRDDKPIQVIPSGPEMRTSIIYETVVSSIYAAKETIDITTPYLIPDESLLLALTNAARRDVRVRIIVPKKVDSFMVRHASRSYFNELLEAGIELYEFQNGLLHTKIISIDGSVSYLGTVNLDIRSFYLNLEVTIALHSNRDCQDVSNIIDGYLSDSERIKSSDWMDGKRSRFVIFLENFIRLAGPLL